MRYKASRIWIRNYGAIPNGKWFVIYFLPTAWILTSCIHSLPVCIQYVAKRHLRDVSSFLCGNLKGCLGKNYSIGGEKCPPPLQNLWGFGTPTVEPTLSPTFGFPSHSSLNSPVVINRRLRAVISLLLGNVKGCLGENAIWEQNDPLNLGESVSIFASPFHPVAFFLHCLSLKAICHWKQIGRDNLSNGRKKRLQAGKWLVGRNWPSPRQEGSAMISFTSLSSIYSNADLFFFLLKLINKEKSFWRWRWSF